jgi:hypothetical protein
MAFEDSAQRHGVTNAQKWAKQMALQEIQVAGLYSAA